MTKATSADDTNYLTPPRGRVAGVAQRALDHAAPEHPDGTIHRAKAEAGEQARLPHTAHEAHAAGQMTGYERAREG